MEKGWAVCPGYLEAARYSSLQDDLYRCDREGKFTPAGIGRQDDNTLLPSIRNDRTLWLSKTNPAQAAFLLLMEKLRCDLNRDLFLGLFEYEAHYALYDPGGFYKKHLDSLRGEKNRIVSTVLYLNTEWTEDQGGQLVIYDPQSGQRQAEILPAGGTLVVFLSEDIPHEVIPASRERCSIAGWFRCNASTAERIDPPR
ncbi:MAG: 2OG-Fe(II) oxygenase [Rhodospirillales bacterium]|nr:2OG-Fe(II) oxygenase [Rhodospirillales bacterium]MCB9997243.1 2OG-Fe(II) oxygenase [Rhodospirillales bacterium]